MTFYFPPGQKLCVALGNVCQAWGLINRVTFSVPQRVPAAHPV